MNNNKTGFQSYEDLPVTEQEKKLIEHHAAVRAGKFEDAVVEGKKITTNDSKKARWEEGAALAKDETVSLTALALAEIYKYAIEKNLEKFKNKYNQKHVNNKISLALTLNKRIFEQADARGSIAQAAVAVEIRENGIGRILVNKVYNFTHKRQLLDEGEWKLTLYQEILYELVGGFITLAILTNPENNIQMDNGNKEQDNTSEQTDPTGNFNFPRGI